jgi:hypothetical protein
MVICPQIRYDRRYVDQHVNCVGILLINPNLPKVLMKTPDGNFLAVT